MRLLYLLADLFINTFGITKPSERARKQAAFFIFGLTILVVALASTAYLVLHVWMR